MSILTPSLSKPAGRPADARQTRGHPFLITRRADFNALIARATRSPWQEMREGALHLAWDARVPEDGDIRRRSTTLAGILSATALAYVLEPDQRSRHAAHVAAQLRYFASGVPGNLIDEMRATADKTLWVAGTPTGNAFFQGVLALDIVYDDVPADERAALEAMLADGPAAYFAEHDLAWKQGSLAARAVWPLYTRDAAAYGPVVEHWRADVLASLTPDGVFTGGTGYAEARWGLVDREHKAVFGELLAHVGLWPEWYDEPRVRSFFEWITGYAYTAAGCNVCFGDATAHVFRPAERTGLARANRYGPTAGGYAAALYKGRTPPPTLASYVLQTEPLPAPAAAPSRVFASGGAWLRETSLHPLALGGALWNLKRSRDAHAHKETNALALSAYGELLTEGTGYAGWADGAAGFSWDYVHHRAVAGNVALFDYAVPQTPADERNPPAENDHVAAHGDGVTASLLTGVVDYAAGDSGPAIPNGRHVRNFLFVHPDGDAHGYFASIDELTAARPGATAQLVWHPSSAECSEVVTRQEYAWRVRTHGERDVGLSILMATPPARVHQCDGVQCNWDKIRVGRYAVAEYPTDDRGRADAVTVLFPSDADHAKADLSPLAGDGCTGALIRQGGVTDVIFVGDGEQTARQETGTAAHARAGLIRRDAGGRLRHVWLKAARRFAADGVLVQCDMPVTLLMTGDALHVDAPAACTLTLRRAGLERVGDVPAGDGVASVTLPPGRSTLAVVLDVEKEQGS